MPPKTREPEKPKTEGFGLRKKFHWLVTLHRNDGQILENVEYATYWDPQREGTADLIMESCAAEHSVFHGGTISGGMRQFAYSGVAAVLQN